MATAQTHLVASLRHGAGVVECVRTVNQFVAQHSAEREFVTLFLGIIDTEARTLTCVDAGHGYAALVCPGIGAERINVTGGLPIGIDTVANYGSSELALPEGCRLVLFSDGIPEQRSPEGEEFGFGRVLEILNHCTDMEADITAVTNGLRAFAESDAFADDVTMASIGMV